MRTEKFTREQSPENVTNRSNSRPADWAEAAYRIHLGSIDVGRSAADAGAPRTLEEMQAQLSSRVGIVALAPADLSDAALETAIGLMAAQSERLAEELSAELAEAQRAHGAARATKVRVLGQLLGQVRSATEKLDAEYLHHELGSTIEGVSRMLANAQSEPAPNPLQYRTPDSLGVALAGCRKEQRDRAAGKQAEVDKLRAQLAALGLSV